MGGIAWIEIIIQVCSKGGIYYTAYPGASR